MGKTTNETSKNSPKEKRVKTERTLTLSLLLISTAFLPLIGQSTISEAEEKSRTEAYEEQLEEYLNDYLVTQYSERAGTAWNRDYSSIDAFERSTAVNRDRWKAILHSPTLKKTGPLQKKPHSYLKDIGAEWIKLPLGPLTAEAVLVFPPGASPKEPAPLAIAQHGIGSYPETSFGGYNDDYHAYAKALLEAGFAVLSPMNLRSVERRNYIERLCRLADTSLPGIELARLQHLLDVVLADPRVDNERVGMWGVSLGGMATMFWMPLEPRIKAGVVSAWFNKRPEKMVVADDRYVSFIVTEEEHAFFQGWLTEFTDHDVVSLICPRPLLMQHGKKDRIAHWPQVIEEFDIAKTHYQKLGIEERIELDIHNGGHEAIVESGLQFMKRWLMAEETD